MKKHYSFWRTDPKTIPRYMKSQWQTVWKIINGNEFNILTYVALILDPHLWPNEHDLWPTDHKNNTGISLIINKQTNQPMLNEEPEGNDW